MCKQTVIRKVFCRAPDLGALLYVKDTISLENNTQDSPLPDICSTYKYTEGSETSCREETY